jgi:hypothetical protein
LRTADRQCLDVASLIDARNGNAWYFRPRAPGPDGFQLGDAAAVEQDG